MAILSLWGSFKHRLWMIPCRFWRRWLRDLPFEPKGGRCLWTAKVTVVISKRSLDIQGAENTILDTLQSLKRELQTFVLYSVSMDCRLRYFTAFHSECARIGSDMPPILVLGVGTVLGPFSFWRFYILDIRSACLPMFDLCKSHLIHMALSLPSCLTCTWWVHVML